VKKKNEKIEQA